MNQQLMALGLEPGRLERLIGAGQIGPACEANAEQLTRIYNETASKGQHSPCSSVGCTVEQMRQMISSHRALQWPMWVLKQQGTEQLLAWVELRPFSWAPDSCKRTAEMNIYIAQEWCGRGLGAHLLQLGFALAQRMQLQNVVGWVLAENPASARLSRIMGGQLWGRFPKLAETTRGLVDVELYGVSLEDFFARPMGRRMLKRMAAAQAMAQAA